MAGPTILRNPVLTVKFGAAAAVDLSAHVVAVDIQSDVDTIDVATFGNPKATENGKVTDTIVFDCLWSPELYDALEPNLNTEGAMVFKLDAADTKSIQATVKFATLPWGRFEVGQRVEDALALAVLTEITYVTNPA